MTDPDQIPCALVLLAAGGSSRMGRPKQLLPVGGRPLVRLVAEQALAAPVAPVVVVLGAGRDTVAAALDGLPVELVDNPGWAEGLGSSLRAGVAAALERSPQLAALVVALADQPDALGGGHVAELIAAHRRTGRGVVASVAGGVPQPPVLFGRAWFPRLLALSGDAGARTLIRAAGADLATVPLAAAADLDTPDDYARYGSRA